MFNDLLKKMDRQRYPFVDGLYYLFIVLFIILLFIFFS
jgi:hypothetical protein